MSLIDEWNRAAAVKPMGERHTFAEASIGIAGAHGVHRRLDVVAAASAQPPEVYKWVRYEL